MPEHLGLGTEHRQIPGQARAVALLGDAIAVLGSIQRRLLVGALACQRIDARELIGALLYSAQYRVVIGRYRAVDDRLAALVLRPQPAGVEQR